MSTTSNEMPALPTSLVLLVTNLKTLKYTSNRKKVIKENFFRHIICTLFGSIPISNLLVRVIMQMYYLKISSTAANSTEVIFILLFLNNNLSSNVTIRSSPFLDFLKTKFMLFILLVLNIVCFSNSKSF